MTEEDTCSTLITEVGTYRRLIIKVGTCWLIAEVGTCCETRDLNVWVGHMATNMARTIWRT